MRVSPPKISPQKKALYFAAGLLALLLAVFLIFNLLVFRQNQLEPEREIEAPDYPVVVGNITLDELPTQIISLDDDVTQTLLNLGLGGSVIGVGNGWDDTTGMKATNHLGTVNDPNYDSILTFPGALLITSQSLPSGKVEQLAAQNIQILVLSSSNIDEDGTYTTILTKLWGNYADELNPTTESESAESTAE